MKALEYRDSISLQSRGQISLLSKIVMVMSLSREGLVVAPYQRMTMFLTARSGITWTLLHYPVGTGAWGTSTSDASLITAIAVLCPLSLTQESNQMYGTEDG